MAVNGAAAGAPPHGRLPGTPFTRRPQLACRSAHRPACAPLPAAPCSKVPKKVTCCCFTADGAHVLAADKFGDVLVAAAQRPASLPAGQAQEPETLLGHYCAILTSLSLSSDGRLLATTDRCAATARAAALLRRPCGCRSAPLGKSLHAAARRLLPMTRPGAAEGDGPQKRGVGGPKLLKAAAADG